MPKTLVWEGEGAVGKWRPRQPLLTDACQSFRGVLAAKMLICRPADPEAKGLVERLHDYLERSFLPGRTFVSPADFSCQLQGWLAVANGRRKRSLGCAPTDRVGADRAAMLTLPPVPPADRLGVDAAAAAGPLRPVGQQRLLRPPVRGRAPGAGPGGPAPGPSVV